MTRRVRYWVSPVWVSAAADWCPPPSASSGKRLAPHDVSMTLEFSAEKQIGILPLLGQTYDRYRKFEKKLKFCSNLWESAIIHVVGSMSMTSPVHSSCLLAPTGALIVVMCIFRSTTTFQVSLSPYFFQSFYDSFNDILGTFWDIFGYLGFLLSERFSGVSPKPPLSFCEMNPSDCFSHSSEGWDVWDKAGGPTWPPLKHGRVSWECRADCVPDIFFSKSSTSRTVLDLVWWQNAHLVAPCLTLGGHFCHQGWGQLGWVVVLRSTEGPLK